MSDCRESKPAGQQLIDLINFLTSELRDLRGFELPVLAMLLHLNRAPGGALRCSRADLGLFAGTSEATAWRLAVIMKTQNLIDLAPVNADRFRISLAPQGQILLLDIQTVFAP